MYIDGQIIFCADGVLRIYFGSPLLSVKDVQEHEKLAYQKKHNKPLSDYKFWTNWWHSEVLFEKGLTLGKFLQCLEPWAEFFADLTGKDVPAYIAESKKLIIKDSQYENAYLALFSETEFSADRRYPEDDLDDENDTAHENFLKMLSNGKKAFYDGNWTWWNKYMITLYYKGESDHYSVSSSPLNKFAHLPIYLDEHQYMYEFDTLSRSVEKHRILINENVHGVQKAYSPHDTTGTPICFLMGKKRHTTREVIEGFFNFFAPDPQTRDYRNEEIQDLVDRGTLEEDDEPTEIVENDKTVARLVLIKEGQELPQTLPESNSNSEKEGQSGKTTEFEVVTDEGAYDDLFNFWDQQIFYWQGVVESISKKPEVVIKLNYVQPDSRPELRMFGMIVDKIDYELAINENEDNEEDDNLLEDEEDKDDDNFKV